MTNGSNRELTNPIARNALITANGIILGFAINFAKEWMFDMSDPKWEIKDWWFGAPFLLSLILLVGALGTALLPYDQTVSQYNRSAFLFLSGIVFAFLAIFLSQYT